MASLSDLRQRIDRLDDQLLDLLNQRGRLVQDIGTLKEKSGQSIFAPGRESDLLRRLRTQNNGPLPDEAVENLFREVVHACRHLQKELRIAHFGPQATFAHQAAMRAFGRRAVYRPTRTITEVFSEVEKDRADFGVVPVENSTDGIITHTLDMFVESTLSICAELELPISHYLLGKGKNANGARTLYSHYQPLAQCRQWIEAHLPDVRVVEAPSTAEAARLAARHPGSVAIASRLASEVYGLNILASRIEDTTQNFTRFLVIGTAEPQPTGKDKTSIMVSIKDRVGALNDMLLPFKRHKVNMTRIESRPTRLRAWEYIFFVDFLGHRLDKPVQKVLQQLEHSCVFLKVLGSYPRTE